MKKFLILSICVFLSCCSSKIQTKIKNTNIVLPIQNDKNDVLYGETLYPEQIKSVINKYNKKYNIDISYANGADDFLTKLMHITLTEKPKAIFQYNELHKYGFIFLKYNNQNYCICIDTVPHLSEYTQNLYIKNKNLFIKFNNKEYRAIMFGENLQKAMKGCGSFTLVLMKHLLKNNAKILYEIINLEDKYGTDDKLIRDQNKKSCIRSVNFDIIKQKKFAKDIYKYAQSNALQTEFDDDLIFKKYRESYNVKTKNKNGKTIIVPTKIFEITQKYKKLN